MTRQTEALRAIRAHIRAHRQPPTREELGHALGITKVSAHLLIEKLEASGRVTRGHGWRNVWPVVGVR